MTALPNSVKKYFWGDDLNELNWENHKDYISKTILEKGNFTAIRWLLKNTQKSYLLKINKERVKDSKSKNFWKHYLS